MEENTLFPGHPNYIGPTKGWFGFIHHAVLFEYSHNIMERVDFVKQYKPKNEIPTRLNHLISLAALSPLLDSFQSKWDALDQEYRFKRGLLNRELPSKRDTLDQEIQSKRGILARELQLKRDALYREYQSKRDTLNQEYRSKRAALYQELLPTILNYIKQYIPGCAWNGNQLQFPQEE